MNTVRRLLTLIACALLLACGNDDDPTLTAESTTSTTATAEAPTSEGTPTPDTEPGRAPSDQPPTTVITGTPPPPAAESPEQESAANGDAGSFARQILAGGGEIVIEVIAQQSAMPRQSTLAHVAQTLQEVSGKPVASTVAGTPAPLDDVWTADEVRAVADSIGTSQSDGRAVLHIVFVHGRWHESDTVLGVAVRGDTAAIFVDAVDEAASPLVGPGAIEEAVTMHEVGHLLGLVDLFLQTGRADPEHPGHSSNRSSVMYWAVESTLLTDVLTGGPPRDFDADDLRDLATIRGA
jgi:hypothetical protein